MYNIITQLGRTESSNKRIDISKGTKSPKNETRAFYRASKKKPPSPKHEKKHGSSKTPWGLIYRGRCAVVQCVLPLGTVVRNASLYLRLGYWEGGDSVLFEGVLLWVKLKTSLNHLGVVEQHGPVSLWEKGSVQLATKKTMKLVATLF